MSEEEDLGEELDRILGRVQEIKQRLDKILEEEREDKTVAWRTRFAVLLGVTTSI